MLFMKSFYNNSLEEILAHFNVGKEEGLSSEEANRGVEE